MTMELRLSIAQDLSAIEDMYARLRAEAVNRAGDPDIPGGAAMVMLGPGADVEAWGYVQLSSMFGRLNIDAEERDRIERSGIEPPLSFLASWADIVREERGLEPSGTRAAIQREVAFLRASIDWMLSVDDEGEPWWLPVDDFARRLHQVRRTLENVLHEGQRHERITAECQHCEHHPQLCVKWGNAEDGSEDGWYCKDCHRPFKYDDIRESWRKTLVRRGNPPEWIPLRKAAAALGRPVTTLRDWTKERFIKGEPARPFVESEKRDGVTWVLWADARAKDDTTQRRKRAA